MSCEATGGKMNNQKGIPPQAIPPSPDKSKLPESSISNDLCCKPEPQPQPQATKEHAQMKGRCIRAGLSNPECPNKDREDVPLWTGDCYRCHHRTPRGKDLTPKQKEQNAEHNAFCEQCAWGYIDGKSLQCPVHKKTAHPPGKGYKPQPVLQ